MLPGLYDDERRTLMRLASMLILGGVAVLPLTTQGSSVAGAAGTTLQTETLRLPIPTRLTFPGFSASRDPFVPDEEVREKLDAAIHIPSASLQTSAQGATPVIRAVVLGNPARALVEEDGTVRVLAVGDRIGDLRVTAIAAGGITLSDGTHMPLTVAQRQ
ncbi:MAG: hypothetical protein ABR949_13970 [Candidatus Aquilonibacter sp.]|jgi:lipoprotein-anchoring transpeptidase ErfK/SrfK